MNTGSGFPGRPDENALRRYSILGYGLMIASIIPLIFLRAVFSPSPIVVTIQILSVGLMVWARITFGSRSFHFAANPTQGGLVTSGPYRFIRHPIYASILYFVAVGVAANLTLAHLGLFGALCVGVTVRIACEEVLVGREYPDYRAYARRTKRIIPFLL